jgi:hypothetical protein
MNPYQRRSRLVAQKPHETLVGVEIHERPAAAMHEEDHTLTRIDRLIDYSFASCGAEGDVAWQIEAAH